MLEQSWQAAPILWIGVTFILGLCIGSFLNVVIYRLPEMMRRGWLQECVDFLQEQGHSPEQLQLPASEPAAFNLSRPASRCPSCGHPIRPWENIPVLSYLLLGGKCSQCKTRIAWRYPAIELLCRTVIRHRNLAAGVDPWLAVDPAGHLGTAGTQLY